MHEITLYDYLAYSDQDTQQAVMDIIRSKGYQINPNNSADLANVITTFVGYEGDKGVEALAMVHPDRELILRTAGKRGADGSTQPQTANMQAVHGNNPPPATSQLPMTNHTNNTPIIAGLMGLVVLGIVAIIAKR